ncbi:NAD-dependent epimerase/dehydratase family protein [Tenacibaculum geojense]|uniref:NAD-dependent epimerase/dehydratase family protein n=1 Tax=Tenacibaculum geojense TaxID=915352 RepID=A0ABW3JX15_9FLAO
MEVLLTGASGFLGKEIFKQLVQMKNFNITTIGRSDENDIICDLSNDSVPGHNITYDMVVHAAGKAHSVPKTKEEEEDFFNVNYKGTRKILNGLKENLPNTIVFISSVSVYGLEHGQMIDESFSLKGIAPYAKSKILAEKEILKFCKANDVNYVILRLPLISGSNPPGNLGKMINAIKKGYYFRIGKGEARKSMVSAIDVASLIPNLYEKNGIYNLTDRIHPSFKQIEDHIALIYNKKIMRFPKLPFVMLAKIGDILPKFIINTDKLNKITKSLTFSDNKAVKELNWKPSSGLISISIK